MTFDEAKKIIADYEKQSTEDYNRYEDEISRGEADAYKRVLVILGCIESDTKGKPTIMRLARELRKIFRFKYLTLSDYKHKGIVTINCWMHKPYFKEDDCTWGSQYSFELLLSFDVGALACTLDFSNYWNTDGRIDYSKCIVEVKE